MEKVKSDEVVKKVTPKQVQTFTVDNFNNIEMFKVRFKKRYGVKLVEQTDLVCTFEGKSNIIKLVKI